MADKTLLDGGDTTASTTTTDPVVQTLADLDAHVKALPPEQQAEFTKLAPAERVAALSTAKQTREVTAYAEKLQPEEKAAFEKLDAAGKTAAIATAKQTAAYTEKLSPEQKAEFEKLKPEERTAKIAEAVKAEQAASAVPEKYDFRYPEGFQITEEQSKLVDETFKGLKLNQANASKLMDVYVKTVQKANADAQNQLAAQQKAWREEFNKTQGHEEILRTAVRGLSHLSPENQQIIKTSWFGDSPIIRELLVKLGEFTKEDTTVRGKEGGGRKQLTAAQAIYPDLPSEATG